MAKGIMNFRYTDQAAPGTGLDYSDFSPGDLVVVAPGQVISQEFLDKEVGTSGGKTYYGKTGLSFLADNPKICGTILVVKEAQSNNIALQNPFRKICATIGILTFHFRSKL